MCHACNICKGDKDLVTWLSKQTPFFGEVFLADLEKSGGVYQGVILQKVLNQAAPSGKKRIELGALSYEYYVGTNDERLGIGLGRYVNEWFSLRNQAFLVAQKSVFQGVSTRIREQLIGILKLRIEGNTLSFTKAMLQFRKQITEINGLIDVMENAFLDKGTGGSSSSEDRSQERDTRREMATQAIKKVNGVMHISKQARRYLEGVLDVIPPSAFDELWDKHSQKWRADQSYTAVGRMYLALLNTIDDRLQKQANNLGKLSIQSTELDRVLDDIYNQHADAHISISEWHETQAAARELPEIKTRADAEAQARQAAEARADTEAQARQALEREFAAYRKKHPEESQTTKMRETLEEERKRARSPEDDENKRKPPAPAAPGPFK